MSDEHGLGGWLQRARGAPSRVERTELLVAELRDLLLRDLHFATIGDDKLNQLLHVARVSFERLDAARHHAEQDRAAAEESVRALTARIEIVRRELQAADRDAAAAEMTRALERSDQLAPGLSVLIATWNHATRVRSAIESALQVVPGDRVIVLDDASTDATGEVLASIPGIRVLRAPRNLGLTRARNVLLHAARTTRALFLDADNVLEPDGIRTVDDVAAQWDATITHGSLIAVDEDGVPQAVLSSVPLDGSFFALRHNLVDTLAVVDVAAVRGVGGYTLDPALETAEDWDMWHRLASTGGLLAFVPCVTGRKLVASSGHNAQPQDHDHQLRVVERTYRVDDRLTDETVAALVVHPATGPLWASHAAVRLRPELGEVLGEQYETGRIPAAAAVRPAPPSVLVVGPGGTRDLATDACTIQTIRRLRELLDPEIGIEVLTDGDRPSGDHTPGIWLGTVREFAHRPLDHHLAVVISGAAIDERHAEQAASRDALSAMARRSGVPVLLSGTSVGAFHRDVGVLRELFEHAAAIGVRDPSSARAAAVLGAAADRIHVVGDDVAMAGSLPDLGLDLPGLPERGWLVFSARDEVPDGERDGWAGAVDAAAVARGVPVIAVAQSRREPWDVAHLARIAAAGRAAVWHVLDVTDDLDAARVAFGRASSIVTTGSLGAWLGLEAGVPTLFVAEGEGPERLAELADLPAAFSDRSVPASVDDLEARWKTVSDRAADRPTDRDTDTIAFLSTHLRQLGVALR